MTDSPLSPAALARYDAEGLVHLQLDGTPLDVLGDAAEGHFGQAVPYAFFVTQRSERQAGFSSATETPPARHIRFHNECSYLSSQPTALLLVCPTAECTGGQTLVADTARVAQTLAASHPELLDAALEYRWVLPDAAAVGRRLKCDVNEALNRLNTLNLTADTDAEGRLHIRSRQPATRRDRHGRLLWTNHLWALHHSAIDAGLARLYQRQYQALPHDVTFADGTPIPERTVAAVGAAYEAHSVSIRWHSGDGLLIDNLRFAHGRAPYKGRRDLWVKLLGAT